MYSPKILFAIFTLSVFFISCSTVHIEYPESGGTMTTEHPITIKIDKDADVATFHVYLDDEEITELFGEVKAGSTVTATSPPLKPLHPDGPLVHFLTAEANWVGGPRMFGSTKVTYQFNALRLTLTPTDSSMINCEPLPCVLEIKQGHTGQMRVELPEAPYGELGVTITPRSNIVAIEGMPPGEPARVVIPSHLRYTTFTIRGIQPGEVYVDATASATEPYWYQIRVIE